MKPAEAAELLRQAGLRVPQTLTLAITGACNLYCRHCWVEAGESTTAGLPGRTLRRLVDEFAALGGAALRLTGGEPLCHPDWEGLLGFARARGLRRLMLQTNAMLLDDAAVAALCRLDFPGLAIEVSLDGATAQSHDLVRGAGAFELALAGIRRLAGAGLARRIVLAFTEMRHNLEEFPLLLDLAAELGVASVVAGTLVQGGRAAADDLVAPPALDQYLRLVQRYDEEPRFRRLYADIGKMAALEWHKGDAPRVECCTFVENPYLTPTGRLYPCLLCHADDFAVSAVGEKGLAAALAEGVPLWASLAEVSRRRAAANPQCRECPGERLCAAGCMGRAWGSCGDLLAVDDRCGLRRAIYRRSPPSDS